MADPFDDFAAEMNRRTRQVQQEDAQMWARQVHGGNNYTEAQLAERALLSTMKDYPLKRGQMLLLGPRSVKALTTPGGFNGTLPDALVLERKDWSPGRT